jgi:hypothetical protein
MNLNENPDIITWPETHYLYIEKIGPFQNTAPEAWGALHPVVAQIAEHNQIKGYASVYKLDVKIYRAGVIITAPASHQQAKGLV